jgi:glutamyl-tRNA synthetase
MWPVRIALTGKLITPGGAVEALDILGKEESILRIEKGIQKISEAMEEKQNAGKS